MTLLRNEVKVEYENLREIVMTFGFYVLELKSFKFTNTKLYKIFEF